MPNTGISRIDDFDDKYLLFAVSRDSRTEYDDNYDKYYCYYDFGYSYMLIDKNTSDTIQDSLESVQYFDRHATKFRTAFLPGTETMHCIRLSFPVWAGACRMNGMIVPNDITYKLNTCNTG